MTVISKLELNRGEFFPQLFANESLTIFRLSATSFRFARFLWDNINANANEDRLGWSGTQWQHYLTDPRCEFFACLLYTSPSPRD